LKFDLQLADKLGTLLRGRKDTVAPAVSAFRVRGPPLPPRFRRLRRGQLPTGQHCRTSPASFFRHSPVSHDVIAAWIQQALHVD